MIDPLLKELEATGILAGKSSQKANPVVSALIVTQGQETASFDTKLAQALRSILEPALASMRAKLDRLLRVQAQVQVEMEPLVAELQELEQFVGELKVEVEHDVQEVQ
jgi:hypothetical protein